KEGKQVTQGKKSFEEKLTWFREILDWQNDTNDAEEFMESLKVDLFSDMVYVFTPKGDVIELPSGSVPLDFAYKIHTEIGNKTIGAKVNGKMESLDYELKNGDIIDVMTSKHSYGPSQDWLKITQTSQAKNKIKQYFKKQKREENITKGKELVDKELRADGIDLKEAYTAENIERVMNKYNFTSEDDMFAAAGYQGISAALIATRLSDKIRKEKEKEQLVEEVLEETAQQKYKKSNQLHKRDSGVEVPGVDNLLIRLAKCCNPVPGDDIVVYITKGRSVTVQIADCPNVLYNVVYIKKVCGVSVHRAYLPNVIDNGEDQRYLDVKWKENVPNTKHYHLELEITGYDRNGLLNEVLQAMNEMKTTITEVNGKSDRNKMATIHIVVLIHNTKHLHKIVEKLKRIKDVYTVRRTLQ